jgi:hypothetical protein
MRHRVGTSVVICVCVCVCVCVARGPNVTRQPYHHARTLFFVYVFKSCLRAGVCVPARVIVMLLSVLWIRGGCPSVLHQRVF